MFQHENAQPHVTRICTQFPDAENVPVLRLPAYSPVAKVRTLSGKFLEFSRSFTWEVKQNVPGLNSATKKS
jgi:hypothetical protein